MAEPVEREEPQAESPESYPDPGEHLRRREARADGAQAFAEGGREGLQAFLRAQKAAREQERAAQDEQDTPDEP